MRRLRRTFRRVRARAGRGAAGRGRDRGPVAPRRGRGASGRGRDRGSAAVELAILAPAILLALFASVQVATYFLARSVALAAAQEAVTAQRAYNAQPGIGQERGTAFLARSGDWLVGGTVVVESDGGDAFRATVTGQALSIIPGVSFHVTQTARGSRERFTTGNPP
jgi:hypothetical protein